MKQQVSGILLFIALLCAIVLWGYGPVEQGMPSHRLADARSFWGIPYFFDVVSNIVFFLAPCFIFCRIRQIAKGMQYQYFFHKAMAYSLILLGIGAFYYHLQPHDHRLVWDLLPIASFFSLLFIQILFETNMVNETRRCFVWSLCYWLVGCSTVFWWHFTGDLRPYVFAHFFPLIALLVLVVLFYHDRTCRHYVKPLLILIIGYGLTKVFEVFDEQVFLLTSGLISGHTLKHLSAGMIILTYFVVKSQPLKEDYLDD